MRNSGGPSAVRTKGASPDASSSATCAWPLMAATTRGVCLVVSQEMDARLPSPGYLGC